MKPGHDDRRKWRAVMSEWTERSLEGPKPPEIVGEVANPVLEALRRLWWRALDRVCNCFVLRRLSIHDRIYGPEPLTPADLKREADHERLVRGFPWAKKLSPRDHG